MCPEAWAGVLDIMTQGPHGIEPCCRLRRDGCYGPVSLGSALDGPDTRRHACGAETDRPLGNAMRLSKLLTAVTTLVDRVSPRVKQRRP